MILALRCGAHKPRSEIWMSEAGGSDVRGQRPVISNLRLPASDLLLRHSTTLSDSLFDLPPSAWRACKVRLQGLLVISAGIRAVNDVPLAKVVATGISLTNKTISDLKATPPIVSSTAPAPALIRLRGSRVMSGPFSTESVKALDGLPSS